MIIYRKVMILQLRRICLKILPKKDVHIFIMNLSRTKSLYRSRVGSYFYGTEHEIWADFWPVGNTEKKWAIKYAKGQLISKWFLGPSLSSKQRTNQLDFTTVKPLVDLFSFVFWRKLTTPKNLLEINWPLVILKIFLHLQQS